MEASSSRPSDCKPTASRASEFLSNLPSCGRLSSSVLSSSMGGLQSYVSDRPTSPPEGQVIMTNQKNILIRSLTLNKQKGDSSAKDTKLTSADGSRKRASEKALEGRSKRAVNGAQTNGQQESSNPGPPVKDFQNLTVERLRALLRERGLPVKGKKDELIARLRGVNG